MNVLWGFLLWLGSGVAVVSMLGSAGLINLALLVGRARVKTHMKVWVGSIVTFTVILLVMPQTIYTHPDLGFSRERAICTLYDAPWVC